MTYPVDGKIQDRFAEGILLTLIEDGPKALQEPENYNVRANVMWAATQALNGLIGAGVPQDWATHMLGHELTAMHGLDHAQTLAIVLPALWNENAIPSVPNCCNTQNASGISPKAPKTSALMPRLPPPVNSSNKWVYRLACLTTVWMAVPSRHCWKNCKRMAARNWVNIRTLRWTSAAGFTKLPAKVFNLRLSFWVFIPDLSHTYVTGVCSGDSH